MSFVPEKQNKYVACYKLNPKKGIGWLVEGFNAQQAIAKVMRHYSGNSQPIFCVTCT